MAAVISSVMSTKDKVPFFVNRCEEMGIEVLPPDVNSSDHGFVVSGNSIRFGLDAVKNVGHAAVETIIAAREADGPFESIWDFCERVDARAVNKRAIECLVKCGALDSTGDTRRGMLEVLATRPVGGPEVAGGLAPRPGLDLRPRRRAAAAEPGRRAARSAPPRHPPVPAEEFDQRELLRLEKETLGTFVSAHPLGEVREALRARVERPLADVPSLADGAWVTVGGIVSEAKKVRTRRGGYVMFAALDDLEGRLELFVRDAASEAAEAIEVDRVVVVRGRVDKGEAGKLSLVVQEAEAFEPGADEMAAARARGGAGARAAGAAGRRRRVRRRPGRRAEGAVRRLPGRERGRARDAHPRGGAAAALRRRLPRRRLARAAGRARSAARPPRLRRKPAVRYA